MLEKSLQENDEECEGIIENPLLHSIDLNVPLWFRSIGFPPFLGKLNILIEFPHCHSCDSLQSIFYTKSCKKKNRPGVEGMEVKRVDSIHVKNIHNTITK